MPAVRKPARPRKWQPSPPELVRFFGEALSAVPEAQARKMFGYPCAFVGGRMFAGLFQSECFLRLSEADRAALLKKPGARPFEPIAGRPMKEYVIVPESVRGSSRQMDGWLRKAFEYTRSLPPKPVRQRAPHGRA